MTMMAKSKLAAAPIHASVPTTDLARAERFYGEVLGLEIEREPGMPQFMAHAGEGCWMLVYETSSTGGSATQGVFTVPDLDAAVADLRKHGVVFEEYDMPGLKTEDGIATFGEMRSAWFKDPDGNTFSVTQTR